MDESDHDPTLIDSTDVGRSPQPGELPIGTRFAGYVIESIAGQGGMGIVYRARQLRPHRIVAVKVITPDLASDTEFRERFEHESEIAASIEHSNVIPVYEVGEESALLFIVMRYVDGTDLRAVINDEERLRPERAAWILSELTDALDAAHARGLVHRDIKPGNVLLAREGTREHVYLTDFGLAKLASSAGRTRTGMFVGTLDYAAPEQLEGRGVDARTDVYAAGCMLFEMLTGSVPFPHQHEAATMWAHMTAQPPSVRTLVQGLPPEIDAVIARAMAKNPDQRFPSAGDLGRAARAAIDGQRATVMERSVAIGPAAPAGTVSEAVTTDAATTPAPGAIVSSPGSAPPRRRFPGGRAGALALGGLAAAAILVLIVSGAPGGTSSHRPRTPTRTPTPRAAATKTYSNARLGVSFSYPASWHAFSLKGSPADFGIATGVSETRCALLIERGAAPGVSSQESQFAFVRSRSASAARTSQHYELRAIQADKAVNITGVGLIRIADGLGAHIGFFFRGADVYLFDCITPATQLDQVDKQQFEPLLASVRIG